MVSNNPNNRLNIDQILTDVWMDEINIIKHIYIYFILLIINIYNYKYITLILFLHI